MPKLSQLLPFRTLATLATLVALSAALFCLAACHSGSSTSSTASQTSTTSTSTASAPTITSQPANQTVTLPQSASFSVTAAGTAPLSYQWQKSGAAISGATSASYTTPATQAADSGSTFAVVVSNAAGSVQSAAATLTVNSPPSNPPPSNPPPSNPPPALINVLTYHNDVARTGQNLNETLLTPSNVNSTNFGKLGFLSVSGLVDAEPLYVSQLTVAGAAHNVVFVATENDMAYAFDADTFVQLWSTSLLGSNEAPSDSRSCGQITPSIGITSTPVIDLTAGPHGAIFLVTMSRDSSGNYYQRLHSLDLTTGAEQAPGPTTISASFPGSGPTSSGGQVTFDPKQYAERSGLLLLNGVLYLGWTSHCDIEPYTGWMMAYSESTLQQLSVINLTPNGSEGSIWMAGAGPAAESSGNIYFLDANGTFDTTLTPGGLPSGGDYGNSFIKLSTAGNSLSVADYFAMHETVSESNADEDLGSGGALVLPDLTDSSGNTWHLAVGAGKDSTIYVVNRDSMGKFNPANDNAIYQEIAGQLGGQVFSMPAYFNNTVYYGAVSDALRAFSISNARLSATASSQTSNSFASPGTTPSVSANGASNGIVWAVENSGGTGILHALNASNLASELYNSNQAGSRDQFQDNKFITPMIANGKVYVGTPTGVVVFGLLNSTSQLRSRPRRPRPDQSHRRLAALSPPAPTSPLLAAPR